MFERSRAWFVAAVLLLGITAVAHAAPIPFDDPTAVPDSAWPLVSVARVVWLGEMHGTEEAPRLFRGLVRLVGRHDAPPLVALEIPTTSQPALDRYMRSGTESDLATIPFFSTTKDGRSSRAMAGLLGQLRSEHIAKVVCMDPAPVTNAQQRDSGMAVSLAGWAGKYPAAKLLVLSGNVHSRVVLGTPWDTAYRPAAFELAK